jgi:hypothetical protein
MAAAASENDEGATGWPRKARSMGVRIREWAGPCNTFSSQRFGQQIQMALAAENRSSTCEGITGILTETTISILTDPDNRQPPRYHTFHPFVPTMHARNRLMGQRSGVL